MWKEIAFCVGIMCVLVTARRGTPPTIRVPGGNAWREPNEYVKQGNVVTLQCLADGNPTPQYMWRKKDKDTGMMVEVQDNGKVSYNKSTGILSATKDFDYSQDGNYSCVAYNTFGKAMTPSISLEVAELITFPGETDNPPENRRAYVSQYLKLECKNIEQIRSKPPVEIHWERGTWGPSKDGGGDELSAQKFQLKENMKMDPEGSLHFLWVTEEDLGFVYVCAGFNKKLLITNRNTHSIKLEKISGTETARDPSLVYVADVTAMAETTAELTCIFSYYINKPVGHPFSITWQHRGNKVGEGEVLRVPVKVPTASLDKSGEYMCEAQLGQVTKQGFVKLTIVSPPTFSAEGMKPIFVPHGKDAKFHCDATSYKAYQDAPIWYINTEMLLDCEDPRQIVCNERKTDGSIKCVNHCDGFPECTDGIDEQNCGAQLCSEGMKLCEKKCINKDTVCEPAPTCVWPSFQCKDQQSCIPKEKVCNTVKECADGSDEKNCPGGPLIQVKRFQVSSDRTKLTLPAVTMNDQMCFQCSVKNQYGMVLRDACLTVIDKIEVDPNLRPNDTYYVEPNMFLNIGISATTDSLYQNQMIFSWVIYNETKDENGDVQIKAVKLPFVPFGKYFQISQTGKNLTVIIPDVSEDDTTTEKYDDYVKITKDRKYAVNISHQYEFVVINFTIIGVDITPPVKVPVVEKASVNLWFIALILAILILFIVIALIVCYMYRNRGGTYPLDKREHQAGHDPAQELKDNAFHDVGRVDDEYDDDKPRPDEVSLSESIKPYESDEDITAEYGEDLDLSKFNEEGSFIFQYGDKKKPKEVTV